MNINRTKEKKLSIAFVVPTFMPESYSGAEKQTLRLASNLKNNNFEAFILAPRLKKETAPESFEGNVLVKRFKVNNLPNLGGRYIFSFISFFASLSPLIQSEIFLLGTAIVFESYQGATQTQRHTRQSLKA